MHRLFILIRSVLLALAIAFVTVVFFSAFGIWQPQRAINAAFMAESWHLALTRTEIQRTTINGDLFRFYIKEVPDSAQRIEDMQQILQNIQKAYAQFPEFVYKKTGLSLPQRKPVIAECTFLSPEDYKRLAGLVFPSESTFAFTSRYKMFFLIHAGVFGTTFQDRRVLKHEIGHFLENAYGIDDKLAHADIEEFSQLP